MATNGYPDPDCCYADVEIMVSCHTGGRSDLVDQHVLSCRAPLPSTKVLRWSASFEGGNA